MPRLCAAAVQNPGSGLANGREATKVGGHCVIRDGRRKDPATVGAHHDLTARQTVIRAETCTQETVFAPSVHPIQNVHMSMNGHRAGQSSETRPFRCFFCS